MEKRKNDYLKYWRVIRYYIKAKYNVTQADLDVILFLYSEKYFDKSKFDEFNELLSWDKKRFATLLRDGWIESFRTRMSKYRAVYQLSFKAKKMVDTLYKKLNGDEISEGDTRNPMFKRNVKYSDKMYRNMIKEMNASIRQQRHHAPE